MNPVISCILILIWIYILHLLNKAKLHVYRFIIGTFGLFILMMVYIFPVFTDPIAKSVAALAGMIGNLTGWFTTYFRYGIVFINTQTSSLSMMIDLECSGIIELSTFFSLLVFYDVYSKAEKAVVGLSAFLYIELVNALRIVIICFFVHLFGTNSFYLAHTFISRIFFYVCTIVLYFYVFTKSQIVRMKVGNLIYGSHK